MKKLVFKLGAASLAVLPVVAVASCSTTTPNQTINTEVSKFEKLFQVSEASRTMTTVEAKESIDKAPTQDEKWNALNKLTQLPEKDSNFTYIVKDATIDKKVDSWLIVTMEIAETTARANNEVLKFVIADLKPAETALDKEVAKFNVSSPVNKESEKMKTNLIITNINNAKDNTTRLAILGKLTNIPTLSPEFTMEILFAKPSAEPTSIEVMIAITEKASGNSKNATFTITGLVALTGQEKLEQQASLLMSSETLFPDGTITAFWAQKIITNTTIFNKYYAPILMAPGVKYEFRGASVNTKVNTTLDVSLLVSGDETTTPILKTVQLTNFVSPKEKLEEQADFLVDKQTLFPDGPTTALKAKADIKDLATLNKYYPPIGMAPGISYEYVATAINANNSILDVTLQVVDQFGTTPVVRMIKLTGFLTPQEELIAVSNKLVDKAITGDLAKETAVMVAGKITSDDTLATYYPAIPLGDEFSYAWKSTDVVGDTVKVTVTVKSSVAGTTPMDKEIILSGFVSPLQYEVNKFTVSMNAADASVKTIEAIRKINEAQDHDAKLAAINSFVNNQFPSISSDFELIIGEASRASVKTSVNVALTIKQKSDKTEQAATFTIANLTAESNQEELQRIADERLKTKPVLSGKEGETAKTAAANINSTETLAAYYEPVTLLKGMEYTLKDGSVEAIGDTVKVIVIVTSNLPNTTPYEKEIIITNFISPLNLEAKRFETPLAALDSSLKTSTTARNLNDKTSSAEKLAFIKTLVADFPEISNGFTLTVGNAIQNPTTPTSINITLTIAHASGARVEVAPTSKEVTFTITGLTSETAQEELKRLADTSLDNRNVLSQKATETSVEAAGAISNSTLDDYYTRTVLGTGITYTYSANQIVGDTLNVTVDVTSNIAGTQVYKRTFTISGFRTLLEAEKLKFTKQIGATTSSTKTTQVIRAINKATTSDAKAEAINQFVSGFPALSNDTFTYTFGTAVRAGTELNSVEIPITIVQNTSPDNSVTATFTITNLTAQSNQEEFNAQLELFTDKEMTGDLAKQTAYQASQDIRDITSLEKYYPRPSGLLEEITYEYRGTDWSYGVDDLPVRIFVRSSEDDNITPVYKTFKLLGFTSPLNFEVTKFTTKAPALGSAPKMQAALRSINTVTELQAKVDAIKALTDGFPQLSLGDFNYEIGTATEIEGTTRAKTSISIPITITNKTNRTTNVATFVITGLVAQTLQEDVDNIATESFGDKDAIFVNNVPEIAIMVSQTIKDKTSLEKYYSISPALPTGFEYTYVTNVIEDKADDSTVKNIRVTINLTNRIGNVSKTNHTFLITGFKKPTTEVELAAVQLAVSKAKTSTEITKNRQAVREINEAQDKLAMLKSIVSTFPSPTGVTLVIGKATINPNDNSSVNVLITITPTEFVSTRTGNLTVTFTITDLTEETPEAELTRLAEKHLINQDTIKADVTALEASTMIVDDSTLNQYYTRVITLGEGISYTWKSDRDLGNDVEVTVDVTDSTTRATVEHKFLITNFPTKLQVLAKKLNGDHAVKAEHEGVVKTNQIVRLINGDEGGEEHQPEQSSLLTYISQLVEDFPVISSTEQVVIGKATLGAGDNPTSVNIQMTVSNKVLKTPISVTFTITGLTAESPQQELERIAKFKFTNRRVLDEKNQEIAAQVVTLIKTKPILETYYKTGFIHDDITYEFVSSSVSEDPEIMIKTAGGQAKKNSIKVNIIVKNTKVNAEFPHSFIVFGFKEPTTPLEKEAAKFAVSLAAKVTDPVLTTIQAIRSFMEIEGVGSEARLNALKALVADNTFPANEATFSLSITGARVNPTTSTSIDVFLTVHEAPTSSGKTGQVAPVTTMDVIFTITGFTVETPQQELQRIANGLIPKDAQTTSGLETTAAAAKDVIIDFDTLVAYYGPIKLGTEMSLTVGAKVIPTDTPNILNISVTINGGANTTPVPYTIKITFPPAETPGPGPSTEGTKK